MLKLTAAFHLCFVLAAAASAQILVPKSFEQPVSSDVTVSPAAGTQYFPKVATNGDISVVAWEDDRQGRNTVYAARVDGNGNVLDPFGVRIGDAFQEVGALVWNGTAFVAILGHTFVFITPDMSVTSKTSNTLNDYELAAVTTGSDPRFLFVKRDSAGSAAIVDGDGNVLSQKPTSPGNWLVSWVGGGSHDGFLVIHQLANSMLAERFDRDGKSLSRTDSGLPTKIMTGREGIAGGDEGFLFVQQLTESSDVAAYFLDAAGVFTGHKITLTPPVAGISYAYGAYRTPVVREADRYIVAWHIQGYLDYSHPDPAQKLTEMVADIGLNGTYAIRQLGQSSMSSTGGLALASDFGKRLIAASVGRFGLLRGAYVFVRSVTPALESSDRQPVTFSAKAQSSQEIASGANGYAVTWDEADTDNNTTSIFVRRFSPSGEPQDTPRVLVTAPFQYDYNSYDRTLPGAKIVSNGATYLVGWKTPAGFVIRRMNAQTGAWIDPQPLALSRHTAPALASNGTDALAVSAVDCDTGGERCLIVTRIPMSGDPALLDAAVALHVAAGSVTPAIATSGKDYLVAWTNGPVSCGDLCTLRQQIFAVRLRSDGSVLDASPLLLDDGLRAYLTDVAVTWTGARYLVAWKASNNTPRGKHVTAQGVVLETGNGGTGVALSHGTFAFRAAALDRHFFFFLAGSQGWESVSSVPDADASVLYAAQPVAFLQQSLGPFSVAVRNGTLAVVYARVGDADSGHVPRLFLRLFDDFSPRRRPAGR